MSNGPRYFSMFSGIGGFELGIKAAMPGAVCAGYSEIDKYAISVYERHFDGHRNFGDATSVAIGELGQLDLVVGGFPCQAFSIAGKRRGFEDTRGTLFFDVARVLKAKRPRHLVLENVKGLLSHDGGKTFQTILGVLSDLGYFVEWQVLNSKNNGVPQNRERIYIVGHLGGEPRHKVFPLTGEGIGSFVGGAGVVSYGKFRDTDDIALTITANYHKGHDNHRQRPMVKQLNNPTHSNDRVYSDDGISPTLNTMQGGNRQPFVRVPEATKTGYAEATVGQAINLTAPNSTTPRGRVSDIAPTVDTGMQLHTLTEDVRIRRLTPKECERLQGFPDDWTRYDKDGNVVSDTQRYKMCGNAVTTNVIQAVMERLTLCMIEEKH